MRTYKSATFAGFSKLAMGCYGYIIYSFTAANVRSGKIRASNAFSFSAMHPGTNHPENMSFLKGPKAMLLVVGCGPSVELRSKNLPMIKAPNISLPKGRCLCIAGRDGRCCGEMDPHLCCHRG